jgi:hypothetical protein
MKNVYKILIGNPKGKRPFGERWYIWEDNVKTDLQEIKFEHLD